MDAGMTLSTAFTVKRLWDLTVADFQGQGGRD